MAYIKRECKEIEQNLLAFKNPRVLGFFWYDRKFRAWWAVSAPKIIESEFFFEDGTNDCRIMAVRSPNLNPLGYYLWRILIESAYKKCPHHL